MTKVNVMLKQMCRTKTKMMNKIFGYTLFAGVVFSIFMYFSKGLTEFLPNVIISMIVVASVNMAVSLIYLCKAMIDETTTNKYRLAPISDNKLYLVSILSNLFSYIYTSLISLVVFLSSVYLSHYTEGDLLKMSHEINNSQGVGTFILVFFMLMLIAMLFTVLINTSNLLTNITINIIPGSSQKIIKGIVNLIILILIFKLIMMFDLSGTIDSNDAITTLLVMGSLTFELIIFSIINANLLRFVETE